MESNSDSLSDSHIYELNICFEQKNQDKCYQYIGFENIETHRYIPVPRWLPIRKKNIFAENLEFQQEFLEHLFFEFDHIDWYLPLRGTQKEDAGIEYYSIPAALKEYQDMHLKHICYSQPVYELVMSFHCADASTVSNYVGLQDIETNKYIRVSRAIPFFKHPPSKENDLLHFDFTDNLFTAFDRLQEHPATDLISDKTPDGGHNSIKEDMDAYWSC
jgi:hypothetical protein